MLKKPKHVCLELQKNCPLPLVLVVLHAGPVDQQFDRKDFSIHELYKNCRVAEMTPLSLPTLDYLENLLLHCETSK